ncbi:MAG: PD40 domain-containing protein [Planctomycetes bacterium]|nr:PD40 domain-containing protein [Planctomycetota bacterium]
MRLSASLARVALAGTVFGLGACGTSVVASADRSSESPAPATSGAPATQHAAAHEQQEAAEVAGLATSPEQKAALGGEPMPMFDQQPAGDRSLVPVANAKFRERFAETGPVSTDGLTQISFAQEGEDFDPTVTPDGKFVVFASTQHRATSDIFIKPVNGSVITQLTNDPSDDAMPSVSPDGRRVAFASNRGGPWNIYVMPVGGGKPVQITATSAHDLHPSWSPDGNKLVFCRLGEVSRRWELWVVEASNPSAGSFLGYGMLPQWCPKPGTGLAGGDRILFQLPRERGARTFGIWAMDYKDGSTSNPTAIITSNTSALINPAWSPDGRFIAFAEVPAPMGKVEINQTRPSQSDLWMMAADGSAKVRLTDGNAVALMPHWGPNDRMVFFSDRGGRGNIWTIDTRSAVLACGSFTPTQATASAAPSHAPQTVSPATPAPVADASHASEAEAVAEEPKH